MAGPESRTGLITFTTVVLVFVSSCHCRLTLTMDAHEESIFCYHLNCWNTDSSDEVLFTITSISLYDVTRPEAKIQLATVKNDGKGVKVNESRINEVIGAGCINRYDADISVNLMNKQDCQSGVFLCEMEFIDTEGHRETLTANAKAVNATEECDCSVISSHLSKLTRRLDNTTKQHNWLRQNYTLEMVALRQQFQNLSEEMALLKNSEAFGSDPTKIFTSGDGETQPAFGSECSRGMSHSSPRVKFLLWGQIPALCDADTDGGGWVILQRRISGDVDFYRDWQSYKTGFGTPDTDFWLGNDVIHNLTSRGNNEFRVDMTYRNVQYYAHYNFFSVDNEQQNYRLTLSGYKGNAGDSLTSHNNMMFSTYDRDNDKHSSRHCAEAVHGAWWYDECYYSNLNGAWGMNGKTGVCWNALDSSTSLSFTELKVRLEHTC